MKATPWHPSVSAMRRVKHPIPAPTCCNYCKAEVELSENKAVYGKNYGDWPYVYHCVNCRAYVGLHPFTNIPLGTLADSATRKARNSAKASFNKIHEKGFMRRTDAYTALATAMGLPQEQCHFGLFDVVACQQAKLFSTQIYLGFKFN